ncbi:unnamed protein product [Urochloa decumbens]|uniref:Serine-threonine/tyrosine-protein kinase catalytic domain-containing protein n=1 Tax=Urochloa decumbens TaxID=240449 RepID=A0ABC8Y9N3_9POAL
MIRIGYKLVDCAISFRTQEATCKVKIPSEHLPEYLEEHAVADPTAILVVKTKAADDIHSIKMMRECHHQNILQALVVAEKGDYITVWAEPHTGPIASCLKSTVFNTNSIKVTFGGKIMLPTPTLQSFVSQIFDGLEYLKLQGKYHGNFSFENTFYHQFGDKSVVKLTDFKHKGSKFPQTQQAMDCQNVGEALQNISKVAILQYGTRRFDCYQIDDLVEKLKEVSWGDMPYIYPEIRRHPFFWDLKTTKTFFVSEIPLALNRPAFRNKVNGCEELCAPSWSNDGYDGLAKLMDDFRRRKSIPDYDKTSKIGYVQFLSGLYAHEEELQAKVSVDAVVRHRNPRVFLMLYNMIPKPPRFTTSNEP